MRLKTARFFQSSDYHHFHEATLTARISLTLLPSPPKKPLPLASPVGCILCSQSVYVRFSLSYNTGTSMCKSLESNEV